MVFEGGAREDRSRLGGPPGLCNRGDMNFVFTDSCWSHAEVLKCLDITQTLYDVSVIQWYNDCMSNPGLFQCQQDLAPN